MIFEFLNLYFTTLMISSTRNNEVLVSYHHALLNAQPEDWWLRMRYNIPKIDPSRIKQSIKKIQEASRNDGTWSDIRNIIKTVYVDLRELMGTWFTREELVSIVDSLDVCTSDYITPWKEVGRMNQLYFLDLTTWPTCAFKDIALQMVARMTSLLVQKMNTTSDIHHEMIVLTSTSGDTWPAWWAAILDEPYITNYIWYPRYEASYIQAHQMHTLENMWKNIIVFPMKEWFSEIQEHMKTWYTHIFHNTYEKELTRIHQKECKLHKGSFNSVNIWRIDAQSIYHVVAYIIWCAHWYITNWYTLSIPTWNFWHAYAALQAKLMLWKWIDAIIISSNENTAIFDLLEDGIYRKHTKTVSCPSVSMIIKYGSNVERLFAFLYWSSWTRKNMELFHAWKDIHLSEDQKKQLVQNWLLSTYISWSEELAWIREVYDIFKKVICPHTANAYMAIKKKKPSWPVLVCETANPWKFPGSIYSALLKESFEEMISSYQNMKTTEYHETKNMYEELKNSFWVSFASLPSDLHTCYTQNIRRSKKYHANDFYTHCLNHIQNY